MRALVTGGSGFIGGHVVEKLLRRKAKVTIFDKESNTYPTFGRAKLHKADLLKPIELSPLDFDVVFHCAGLLGTETLFDRIKEAAEINIIGTINLLDWAMENPDLAIVQPNLLGDWYNIYMISKHCAEEIGIMYHKEFGVPYASVRPSDVYGPTQTDREKKAAPVFIQHAIYDMDLPVYGDGSSWVNYVYVEDVADFLITVYEKGIFGKKIDFCRPCGDMTILEFANKVIELSQSNSKIKFRPMRRGQPGNVQHVPYNLTDACKVYDMTRLTSLDAGLKATISWYRSVMMD